MSWTCSHLVIFNIVVLLASVSSDFRQVFYHSKPLLKILIHSKKLLYDSSTSLFDSRHISNTDYIETKYSSESGSNSSEENIFEHLLSVEESKEELEFSELGITSTSFDFESIYGTPEAIAKTLEMMKVVDLKSFLRHLGGKYNRGDRKAAIVEQCYQYLKSSPNPVGRNSVRNFASSDSSQDKPDLPAPVTAPTGTEKKLQPEPTSSGNFQVYTRTNTSAGNRDIAQKNARHHQYNNNNSNSFNDNRPGNKSYNRPSPIVTKKRFTMQSLQSFPSTNSSDGTGGFIFDGNVSFNRTAKANPNGPLRHPVGPMRDKRFERSSGGGDMDLTFLGTASCIPTLTRGVSCVAMRYSSDIWLFDCGEASQLQIQQSNIKASKIKKIFISHTHGDHAFGIPGVLCLIGQSKLSESNAVGEAIEPVDIYGPEGLRDYIRTALQLTYSRIATPFRVHELKDVPYLHGRTVKHRCEVRTTFQEGFGEVLGGKDIFPDKYGAYQLFDEEIMSVTAAPLQHTIPCVGFVVLEKDRPGTLQPDKVAAVVERNKEALLKLPALRGKHMKIFAVIKGMNRDEELTFPDGTVVKIADVVDPPKKGRKVVILGDTCYSERIARLAMNADVLIHEATNAWVKEMEGDKYASIQAMEKEVFTHGHSTPQMAGLFARRINAKQLILTHFSPRYSGDFFEQSMRIMWSIEDMAKAAGGYTGVNDVVAAWDYLILGVPTREAGSEQEVGDNEVDNSLSTTNTNEEKMSL